MVSYSKKKQYSSNRLYIRYISMTLIYSMSLFLILALWSYDMHDAVFLSYANPAYSLNNWCGRIGACIALLLVYFFGAAYWLFIGLACFFMYAYAKRYHWTAIGQRVLVGLFSIIISAGLCAAYAMTTAVPITPGGMIGSMLYYILKVFFGPVGSLLVLHTSIIIGFILITNCAFMVTLGSCVRYIKQKKIIRFFATVKQIRIVYLQLQKKMRAFLMPFYRYSRTIYNFVHTDNHQSDERINAHDNLSHVTNNSQKKINHQSSYSIPLLTRTTATTIQAVAANKSGQTLDQQTLLLESKLEKFGIRGTTVNTKRGPVVTLFEYKPDSTIKLSKIVALENDLAMALQAMSVRILAPIPGKSVVGFEVANNVRADVLLPDLMESTEYKNTPMHLPLMLGKDIAGFPLLVDLFRMPHLLIAGSTGSGKSVALNALLISLLGKLMPDELSLILIDPKRLEFSMYNDIAHLLFPVVVDPLRAIPILRWVVNHMEERYELIAQAGSRTIVDYNKVMEEQGLGKMPFIVIMIDELADLMMVVGSDIEQLIARIAQKARAAGIHLIVATQRPSVDVITGIIKVNFPSRIAFRVSSKIDSRTIIDCSGAETLLGYGDMLFLDSHTGTLKRAHGAYIASEDIKQMTQAIRAQKKPTYKDCDLLDKNYDNELSTEDSLLYDNVCTFLKEIDAISISLLQRRFKIGYNRSARIISYLESQGLIMPADGSKTRKIIK